LTLRGSFNASALPALQDLPLYVLNLNKCDLIGADWKGLSGQLQNIDLSDSSINDLSLSSLPRLLHLRDLYLSRTHITSIGCLPEVSPNLQALVLNGTPITDSGLGAIDRLQDLQILELDDTRITTNILPILARMPRLELLSLQRTEIDDESMRQASFRTEVVVKGNFIRLGSASC
jgi:Leucine-rich repeat (LRR) protein